ncbi:hypothetical protein Tco_0036931 [Tanacetum coccineum]
MLNSLAFLVWYIVLPCGHRLDSCAWFLGLDEFLSWLLVGGYREANVVLMKAIALLRLEIGSFEGRNDGKTSPESNYRNDACGLHHLLVVMLEVNNIVELLVTTDNDTKSGWCKMEKIGMCWPPRKEDPDIVATLDALHLHELHVVSNKLTSD